MTWRAPLWLVTTMLLAGSCGERIQIGEEQERCIVKEPGCKTCFDQPCGAPCVGCDPAISDCSASAGSLGGCDDLGQCQLDEFICH